MIYKKSICGEKIEKIKQEPLLEKRWSRRLSKNNKYWSKRLTTVFGWEKDDKLYTFLFLAENVFKKVNACLTVFQREREN